MSINDSNKIITVVYSNQSQVLYYQYICFICHIYSCHAYYFGFTYAKFNSPRCQFQMLFLPKKIFLISYLSIPTNCPLYEFQFTDQHTDLDSQDNVHRYHIVVILIFNPKNSLMIFQFKISINLMHKFFIILNISRLIL